MIAGIASGRVRAMIDHNGKKVIEAGPSTPIEILGLTSVPMSGDSVNGVKDDKMLKELLDIRLALMQYESVEKHTATAV